MEEELIKFIIELVGDHDVVCTELHENEEEQKFCSHNCEGVNESCIRRLMYKRIMEE